MVPIWLDGVYREFARALSLGRLPGSVLISGRPGAGVHELAADCIRVYLCLAPAGDRPCGSCRSCQLLAGLGHPDFAALLPAGGVTAAGRAAGGGADTAPVLPGDGLLLHALTAVEEQLRARLDGGDDGGGTIRIEALRRLGAYLHESPVIGSRRAALITHAHLMQAASANALLKLFEEPPPGTLIILAADAPERLLPTILSRAFTLSAAQADPQQALEFVCSRGSVSRLQAQFALACAQGAPYTAQQLIATGQDRLAACFIRQLAQLASAPSAHVLEAAVHSLLQLPRPRRLPLLWLTGMDILRYQAGFDRAQLPLLGSCRADGDAAKEAEDRDAADADADAAAEGTDGTGSSLPELLAVLPRERLLLLLTELCRLQAEERSAALPVRADDAQLRTLLWELAQPGGTPP